VSLAVDSFQFSKNERLVKNRRERRPGLLDHVAQSALAEQLSDLVAQQAQSFRVLIEVETANREVAAHTPVVIEPKDGPTRFKGGQENDGSLSCGEVPLRAWHLRASHRRAKRMPRIVERAASRRAVIRCNWQSVSRTIAW
jgi:hypothetical protein